MISISVYIHYCPGLRLFMLRGDDMDGGSGARRFDMGERNNPILPAMAISALEQLI